MLAAVVVFDPDGTLPPSFAADAAFDRAMVTVDRAEQARRLARRATVVVVVSGRDVATALGFLASVVERRGARLVLFAADADRHRHVILHALRRGAIVLVERPLSVLGESVRDLMALSPPGEVA